MKIFDLQRDNLNLAHPTKIDYLLEAIIVMRSLFIENVIMAAMDSQTLGLEKMLEYQAWLRFISRTISPHFPQSCSLTCSNKECWVACCDIDVAEMAFTTTVYKRLSTLSVDRTLCSAITEL